MKTIVKKHKNYILVENKNEIGLSILTYAESLDDKKGIKLAKKLIKALNK